MPKVSVVVPNYNHARYLPERMNSILKQSFQDFDVLLMDDVSRDNSREVIEQIAATDGRIRPLFNSANTGSGYKQWNRGVRETKGEYVWIAESDDSADLDLLETLVARLDANPNVGIAYCQSDRMDEQGKPLGSMLEWTSDLGTDRWENDFVGSGVEECRRYLCLKNTIPNASAVLFRRAVFEQVGGAREDLRLCADWLLWAQMLAISDIAYIARPLNKFRLETTSVTQNTKRDGTNAEESYRVARMIADLVTPAPEVLEAAREKMFFVWTHPMIHGETTASPARNWRTYQEARAFDARIHGRIARRYAQFIATKLRSFGAKPQGAK